MTSGQERALRELKRLHAVDPDGFDLVTVPEVLDGDLIAVVGIRIGPIECASDGLELQEREEFVLCVPADFPFQYPHLSVFHKRFAGFPHVTWTHTICLYRSAVDWNPRDGLFGFFDKLQRWLGRAATNTMDPVEVALEPPHHVTDFSQIPFVVRANAPVATDTFWVGFAQLEKHTNRIEIVGWSKGFDHWPAGRAPALAIMLPQPLPMEFPRKGRDFFRELEKQHVDRRSIIDCLAMAADFAAEGDPIHLIIGLPMRRATDGSLRLHIAVWTTSPAFAKGLRLTLKEETDGDVLRDMRDSLADTIYQMMENATISWCQVFEDREEIVVRRDQQSAASWFRDKKVLILGCGALGSWFGECVARAGAASIGLVDNGIVKPGLLSRQNYRLEDVGANKAEALRLRLEAISAASACIAFPGEAHAFITQDIPRFRNYDVVIDCTANAVFQMKLERDWAQFERSTPRLIALGIDAHARRCIAVTLPRNSVGGPWDAYLQLKHRLCVADTDRALLESFYSENAEKDLMQPEPGCSDPTFSGSAADVVALAATALNLAVPQLDGSDVPTGIAFTAHVPSTSRTAAAVIQLANLEESRAGKYRIRVSRNVHREARAWVQHNNRARSSDHETGGLLWGQWDDAVEVIWIFDASGPPADSKHEPARFECGSEGTAEEHARRMRATRGVCGFVGMWHTHPDMQPGQSVTDVAGMAMLVASAGQNQRRSIMVIYGRTAAEPAAGYYVYESEGQQAVGEMISVGMTHVRLENPVV